MVTVKYDDLSEAFDFVSFAAPFEHQAFLSLDSGAIYWVSQEGTERALREWCEEHQIRVV